MYLLYIVLFLGFTVSQAAQNIFILFNKDSNSEISVDQLPDLLLLSSYPHADHPFFIHETLLTTCTCFSQVYFNGLSQFYH